MVLKIWVFGIRGRDITRWEGGSYIVWSAGELEARNLAGRPVRAGQESHDGVG